MRSLPHSGSALGTRIYSVSSSLARFNSFSHFSLVQRCIHITGATHSKRLPLNEEWMKDARKAMHGKDPASLIWHTPEGIPIKPIYTREDRPSDSVDEVQLARVSFVSVAAAGSFPVHARAARDDVHTTSLDDPAIRGILDGGRVERVLPREHRRRPARPVGRVRSRDASRVRDLIPTG